MSSNYISIYVCVLYFIIVLRCIDTYSCVSKVCLQVTVLQWVQQHMPLIRVVPLAMRWINRLRAVLHPRSCLLYCFQRVL